MRTCWADLGAFHIWFMGWFLLDGPRIHVIESTYAFDRSFAFSMLQAVYMYQRSPWTPWTKWRKLWRELRRAVRGAQLHVAAVPTIVPHSLLQAIMALLVPRLGSTACCASVVYSVGLTLLLLWHPAGADGHALALNRPCPRLTYCCA